MFKKKPATSRSLQNASPIASAASTVAESPSVMPAFAMALETSSRKLAMSSKVAKGLGKGAYKLVVAVTAGDDGHEPATKTVTVKVTVK